MREATPGYIQTNKNHKIRIINNTSRTHSPMDGCFRGIDMTALKFRHDFERDIFFADMILLGETQFIISGLIHTGTKSKVYQHLFSSKGGGGEVLNFNMKKIWQIAQ